MEAAILVHCFQFLKSAKHVACVTIIHINFFFPDIFKQFLDEHLDVKAYANNTIQSLQIVDQLTRLAEGISLLDRDIHTQVYD